MSPRAARSTAEWLSLAGSAVVLLAVVALIAVQIPGDDVPPAPTARVEAVRALRGAYHVDVSIENAGDAAAENVQVTADLTIGSDEYTGDQTVDFLSGGEVADLTFVFADDPATGELTVRVTGFGVP